MYKGSGGFPPGPGGPGGPGGLPGRSPQPGGYPPGGPGGLPTRSPQPSSGGGGGGIRLQVGKVQDRDLQTKLIYKNVCAVSPRDFGGEGEFPVYIQNRDGAGFVVTATGVPNFPPGYIALNEKQRQWTRIGQLDTFLGMPYDPFRQGKEVYLGALEVQVSFASPNKRVDDVFDEDELTSRFLHDFHNQVLQPGQSILMDCRGLPLLMAVKSVSLTALGQQGGGSGIMTDPSRRGILYPQTQIICTSDARDSRTGLKLRSSATGSTRQPIISSNFDFTSIGIGGLDEEFAILFRKAFASRVFPPATVEKLGIQHVKGVLLHGPPGTGKTLIARQIGKVLNAKEPKVINGPEILNKYVGQSEENIRKVFADAEKEYKEKGDESDLHIIIFDELDAVCKQRGSGAGGGTGVGDSIVNQLLTKLDGVDQLNNILLIGMTNRKDMIDDALLRPGRLELHLEISLPDEYGRSQILNIHTSKLRQSNHLGGDVDVEQLAKLTKNYSGAEISGLVRAATSFAMTRHTDTGDSQIKLKDVEQMLVGNDDFLKALAETTPAFGVADDVLDDLTPMGIIQFNPNFFQKLFHSHQVNYTTVRESPDIRHLSVLLHGPPAAGQTALAGHLAKQTEYPFVKVISPADMVGYRDDFAKKDYLHKVFTDAYKSPLSLLILDDFEGLIDYTPVGPRFSNTILQALITLIKRPPPKGRRLLTLVTTSNMQVIQLLEVDTIFRRDVRVNPVRTLQELYTVLQESGSYPEDVVRGMCEEIQENAATPQEMDDRTFSVGVGIKTVLDLLAAAKQAEKQGFDGKQEFVSAMAEAILKVKGTSR